MSFLGFPNPFPDSRTIWLFRERMAKTKERNRLISKLRSPGERPHAVIKRVFGAGRVLVTTVRRVHVKMMVTAFAFNLYQLCTLKNARIV
jgi:IS5 family transposase